MPGMFGLGGHLGSSVSALVDGQLDEVTQERAWAHVGSCTSCRRAVEREGWTKRQLTFVAGGEPSARLLGSLFDLDGGALDGGAVLGGALDDVAIDGGAVGDGVRKSWAAVAELEGRSRGRRRAGLAAVGVGSVSAAVLGLSTLSGAPLGIGGVPAGRPATTLTGSTSSSSPSSFPLGTPLLPRKGLNGWVSTRPSGPTEPVSVTSPR